MCLWAILLPTMTLAEDNVVYNEKFIYPDRVIDAGVTCDTAYIECTVAAGSFFSDSLIPYHKDVIQLEALALEKALQAMVEHGIKPAKFGVFYKRIFDIDARDKLAKYARSSKDWREYRHAINRGHSPKHDLHTLVVDLINQSGMYDAYNKVLVKYGIRMEATSVEKVITDRFSTLGIKADNGKVIKDKISVPTDAMIQFSFYINN